MTVRDIVVSFQTTYVDKRYQGGIMITDDERREVARRLRERAGKRLLNLGELLWCIGCDEGDDAAAWNRLADLIEPAQDHFVEPDELLDSSIKEG